VRIGIFGGTFSPPHLGHLLLAAEVKEKANLDRLIFMPCAIPPHKATADIPNGMHRLNMVNISIADNPDFEVSDMEIDAGGKSYTAKTLETLNGIFPDDRLCFVVGSDSLCEMERWFCPDEIFRRAEIVVAIRGGMREAQMDAAISFFRQKYNADITKVEAKAIEMSSSDVRERIKAGKSVKYMVSDGVIEYIRTHRLYEGTN